MSTPPFSSSRTCITKCLPVQNVKYPVQAEKQHVMSCDVFNVLEFLDHEQLGQNRQGLQPHTEAPEHGQGEQRLMHNHGESSSRQIEKIVGQSVRFLVIGEHKRFSQPYQIRCVEGQKNEKDLHEEQVEGLPADEEVYVAGEEHDQIHLLCAIRQSYINGAFTNDVTGSQDLEHQQNHCDQMKHVGHQLEEVHQQPHKIYVFQFILVYCQII